MRAGRRSAKDEAAGLPRCEVFVNTGSLLLRAAPTSSAAPQRGGLRGPFAPWSPLPCPPTNTHPPAIYLTGQEMLLVSRNPSGMAESSPSPPRRVAPAAPSVPESCGVRMWGAGCGCGCGVRVWGAGAGCGCGVPLTLLSRRAPLRSTSSCGCGPASAAGTSCSAHSASASPAHSILRECVGNAPGCVRGAAPSRGEESEGQGPRRDRAGSGRAMKPRAEGMSPVCEPGPPPDSPPSPEDAHIFPSPLAFFFFPSLPRFRCQAQDWTRRDAGTGSAAFPSSQSRRLVRGGGSCTQPRGAHTSAAPMGEHDRLPSSQGCGSPHIPLGSAPAVRGSAPSVSTRDPQTPPALGTAQWQLKSRDTSDISDT